MALIISTGCYPGTQGTTIVNSPAFTPASPSASTAAQQAGTQSGMNTPVGGSPIPMDTKAPDSLPGSLAIVYAHGEQLWSWTSGSDTRIISHGPALSPELSSDGKIIGFLRPVDEFHVEIWAINSDGTKERRLVSVAELEAIGGTARDPNAAAIVPHRFEWLPGTHTLAFNTEYAYQGPGTVLLDDFNLVDADQVRLRYQLLPGWGGEFYISPAGSQIALTTATNLILANLDGSNWRKVVTFDPIITYSDYKYYPSVAWVSDGSYLLMALPPTDPLAEPASLSTIYRIDAENSTIQELGQVNAVPFFDTPVSFSPALDQIAYIGIAGGSDENQRMLKTAAANGSGSTDLIKDSLLHLLGWNLDGTLLVVTTGENQQLSLGGSGVPFEQINQNLIGVFDLHWINADWFVFLQGQGEQVRLCVSNRRGDLVVIEPFSDTAIQYDFMWLK